MMFHNLFTMLPFVVGSLAMPHEPLALESRTTYTNFTIYGYGTDNIEGYNLIVKDGE
jgi:hypothetical protein